MTLFSRADPEVAHALQNHSSAFFPVTLTN